MHTCALQFDRTLAEESALFAEEKLILHDTLCIHSRHTLIVVLYINEEYSLVLAVN